LFSSFHLELFSEKTFFAAYLLHANEGTNRPEEHMNAEWKFNIRSHNKYVVIQKLRVLKDYKIGNLLLLCSACSIKEKEKRLVGSESGYCVRVGRYVYPQTVVSVN
jgi:hypothetical protein